MNSVTASQCMLLNIQTLTIVTVYFNSERKLVAWLRQIFRTSSLIDQFYAPWSYLVKTGFEDIFCSMNKLRLYDFTLPVNLAVKQFDEIKDAF